MSDPEDTGVYRMVTEEPNGEIYTKTADDTVGWPGDQPTGDDR